MFQKGANQYVLENIDYIFHAKSRIEKFNTASIYLKKNKSIRTHTFFKRSLKKR